MWGLRKNYFGGPLFKFRKRLTQIKLLYLKNSKTFESFKTISKKNISSRQNLYFSFKVWSLEKWNTFLQSKIGQYSKTVRCSNRIKSYTKYSIAAKTHAPKPLHIFHWLFIIFREWYGAAKQAKADSIFHKKETHRTYWCSYTTSWMPFDYYFMKYAASIYLKWYAVCVFGCFITC